MVKDGERRRLLLIRLKKDVPLPPHKGRQQLKRHHLVRLVVKRRVPRLLKRNHLRQKVVAQPPVKPVIFAVVRQLPPSTPPL